MPNQVVPITNLTEFGLIEDTPSVALPPNAFSDVSNVRFQDGAIRKMPGESAPYITGAGIRYVAHWPAPSGGKFVVISGTDLRIYNDTSPYAEVGSARTVAAGGNWQHTLFNGGFHIILNNGNSTPIYIEDGTNTAAPLPGWASYAVQNSVVDFDLPGENVASARQFDISHGLIAPGSVVRFTLTPRNVANAVRTETITINPAGNGITEPDTTLAGIGTIEAVASSVISFLPATGIGGDRLVITVESSAVTLVTAGVVRAYGNLLVAGNLQERVGGDVIRTLTGVVRTSDVAAPGAIPANWNPFRIGVNTADEFILASTGMIQDMAELQGVLYVYTDSSIHSIQHTNNPSIPFQIAPVTDNYGAKNTGAVLEVDGKHIVCGSNDVYVFAGHPGSISSVADGRVRYQSFFNSPDIQILRFNKYDELWFWSASTTTMYIWNYRDNTWTKREQTRPVSGTVDRDGLVFASDENVFDVDSGYAFNGSAVQSYVERRRLAMTPEFDTETLIAVALMVDGAGQIDIRARGSNAPGETAIFDNVPRNFDIANEYKQDMRIHGRFLNYRLEHDSDNQFNLSAMQFDIGRGGTR